MTKYAVLVLGLLAANAASAAWPEDVCTPINFSRECDRENTAALARHQEQRKEEERSNYERSQPIQVITPNDSYLAYPSSDGRTVQIYDRLGRE